MWMTSVEPNAPTPGFSIKVAAGEPQSRVLVVGELDLLTSPQLTDALTRLLDDSTRTRLLVDLTGVTFFDSSALNVLLQAQNRAAEQQVELAIVASPMVSRVIELTGVTEHLTMSPPPE
jgi:anti-sigma B factor antagonist